MRTTLKCSGRSVGLYGAEEHRVDYNVLRNTNGCHVSSIVCVGTLWEVFVAAFPASMYHRAGLHKVLTCKSRQRKSLVQDEEM